ncbi:hypothetical protein U1Q18_052863 [Sarracenia purpurea var. burkii]
MTKKVVLKLGIQDEKGKQKAMMTVSSLPGIDSIVMDMKDKKLTVTGEVDPVSLVGKLRKICGTEIVTVGPAKEPEKKEPNIMKEDPKKGAGTKIEDLGHPIPPPLPYYNYSRGADEDPNSCVIS